jgi:branched-subunit amino acid ABC-type transport system permease component
MTPLALVIQYIISGMTSGSIYAMVSLCWSIVFLVTGILNFGTGEFVMLGGMFTWVLLEAGLGLAPAVLMAVFATVLVGIIMERLVIRPVRFPSETTFMVITIASASILKGIILIACGSETRAMANFQAFKDKVFSREVEEVLHEHPAIECCAIVGMPNPDRPGSELVKAIIQLLNSHKDKDRGELEQEIIEYSARTCPLTSAPRP